MSELPKTYDPKSVEDKLYKFWVDSGFFHAEVNPDKKPYTIVIPPPNVTGQLHMGHAMDETWQDILTRYKRMQGYAALWVPGTDHASIATEAKVVAMLREKGIEKSSLTREESSRLFCEVEKDYLDIKSRLKRFREIRENPHFNAVQVKFAYAVTCHKAQGGQWAHIYVDQGYMTDDMLSPDYIHWLYTAFTRATEKLFLVNWPKTQTEGLH